jgi:S-adenosylmethionine/arginine decarboxylase-like enzyme
MISKNGDSVYPPYGNELLLDLHGCDVSTFNRESITSFFSQLCEKIEMTACELHFWDDMGLPPEQQQTAPHAKGTSAVQFILTSSMVIHTLDLLSAVYLNIFSCKEFDPDVATRFAIEWFVATDHKSHYVERC